MNQSNFTNLKTHFSDYFAKLKEMEKLMRSFKNFFEEINDDCNVVHDEFHGIQEFSHMMSMMISNNNAIVMLSLGIINNINGNSDILSRIMDKMEAENGRSAHRILQNSDPFPNQISSQIDFSTLAKRKSSENVIEDEEIFLEDGEIDEEFQDDEENSDLNSSDLKRKKELEEKLIEWVRRQKEQGKHLTQKIILKKAEDLNYCTLNNFIPDFRFIQNFIAKYSLELNN